MELEVGALGKVKFRPGYYTYVGSGRKNLAARIRRHRRKDKKLRWHIDYLLQVAEIEQIWLCPEDERELVEKVASWLKPAVRGFGSSDTGFESHLFLGRPPSIDGRWVSSEEIERM